MTARIGLIVNPIAGMGGRVALKGTDGAALAEAISRGAVPRAGERAACCLKEMASAGPFTLIAASGVMGADSARAAGLEHTAVGEPRAVGETSREDTLFAAREIAEMGVDLLLFAGGDGTARDICGAVGDSVLALGIPAGVKIHSAVFASSPTSAGRIAAAVASGRKISERSLEVMDIDEDAYRAGRLAASLYGYLRVPYERGRVQAAKSASGASDAALRASAASGAADIVRASEGRLFFVGAGSTTAEVARDLGIAGTLLGVDALIGGASPRLEASDVTERDMLDALDRHDEASLIVTPIGGQGFIFGRGNPQFSPEVIRRVGRENIIVVSSASKIASLGGEPLRADTGDEALDAELEGYIRVITAPSERAVYRITKG